MKVLFLGPNSGTSLHRFHGFERLGHEAHLIDPRALLPSSALIDHFEWKIHPAPLGALARQRLLHRLGQERFDLVFVDSGSLVSASLVRSLKKRARRVVNFNHDDPFGPRDGVRFASYRAAVPHYDLVVVVRQENIAEAYALGAQRVLHTFRVADDVEHAPRPVTPQIRQYWASEVAFVGTWMPERGPFLARLMNLGIPLSIFGGNWDKAHEWPLLRAAHRTRHLEGTDYCHAVQCAKINLGLLSSGNRDLHTTRSMEIPSLGSVLSAQRTSEHAQLYVDQEEAVFWNGPDDCARVCRDLLHDTQRRERIARKGHERFLANGYTTNRLLKRIIDESFA